MKLAFRDRIEDYSVQAKLRAIKAFLTKERQETPEKGLKRRHKRAKCRYAKPQRRTCGKERRMRWGG